MLEKNIFRKEIRNAYNRLNREIRKRKEKKEGLKDHLLLTQLKWNKLTKGKTEYNQKK